MPAVCGCYYINGQGSQGGYVFLYDPAQAVKTRSSTRQRSVTFVLTEIHWPKQALPLIRDLSDFLEDRDLYPNNTYEILMHDIANIAAHLSAFTQAEIQHMAGDSVTLSISPSLVRRAYASFEVNSTEQIALASRISTMYRKMERHL